MEEEQKEQETASESSSLSLDQFNLANAQILASQERVKQRVREDNDQMQHVCSEAEKKLKKVEKFIQTRTATLNDTKANFAYIYEKIQEIKRAEEENQKQTLLEGHRTYQQIVQDPNVDSNIVGSPPVLSEKDALQDLLAAAGVQDQQ